MNRTRSGRVYTGMVPVLLACLLAQDDEAAKLAKQRAALVERFEALDAIDGRDADALRRANREFATACDDFLWSFEQYVAAYEILALMGRAEEKLALATEGAESEEHWRRAFQHLSKPRFLAKDPAAAGHAEVRRVVLLAGAAEGRARLLYAKRNPKSLAGVLVIVKELAPTKEELAGSDDAARIRLHGVRALARSGEGKAAAESLAAFLAIRPLKGGMPREAPKPETVKSLIDQLGADSLDDRDAASRSLLLMGTHAVKALEEATKSADAEVASRAKAVLAAIRALSESTTVDAHTLTALDELCDAEKRDSNALLEVVGLVARQDPGALRRPAVKAALLKELKAGTPAAIEAVAVAAGRKLTAEEAAGWLDEKR